MYAELQRLVEQSQAELVELIATRQREAERHAQELARGLENELSQLRRRSNELEAYAQTQDKVVFLQVVQYILSGHITHLCLFKCIFQAAESYFSRASHLEQEIIKGLCLFLLFSAVGHHIYYIMLSL